MGEPQSGAGSADLTAATGVDEVARAVLDMLVRADGVSRAGLALVEGGGRRLRFLPGTRDRVAEQWCHIDAYDDVPLARVVRSGASVMGDLDSMAEQYAGLVAAQRRAGTRALAAVPLPGPDRPLGGLIVYFDRPQTFDAPQRAWLRDISERAGAAVRRVRARRGQPAGEAGQQEDERGAGARRAATVALDDDPRAVGVARHFLRDALTAWGLDEEVAQTAELCLSELVTNAVIHAGSASELTVSLEDGRLTVAVRDHGGPSTGGPPHPVEDVDPLRVFGRGLMLVEALSDRWACEQDADGTTSWFSLEVPAGIPAGAS